MDVLDICKMVARSLVAEIGPWGNYCAFFGGLIPGLLVPEPEEPLQPHAKKQPRCLEARPDE
jgi:hypothetical protein